MKVTIKDIAKEANVSTTTVSLVLNHKKCRVSQETKDNIFALAKKYNYVVNINARNLVKQKTSAIGLLIPDIENIFFSSLVKQVEYFCRQSGYSLIIVNSDEKHEQDVNLINMLVSRGVDGLLIVLSNDSLRNESSIKPLIENLPVPYVMLDRYFQDIESNKVYFDNEFGAYNIVKLLIENGHKKIGCIASPSFSVNGSHRVNGYIKAMEENSLKVKDEYIFQGDFQSESGYEAGKHFKDTDVTAIFSCNDMMTLGLCRYLKDNNVTIPNDISVVTYDDILNKYMIGTSITAIKQDIPTLAENACNILFEQIDDKSIENKEVILTPKLISNDSVKKIN